MEKILKFDKCRAFNKAVGPGKKSKINKCRAYVYSGLQSKYLIPIYLSILADTPHVSDCSELERLGINQNGYYYIDPSGQRQNSELSLAYCDNDGWTHILKREHDPSLTYVS